LTEKTRSRAQQSLSVFFPAYNEEDNIGELAEVAVGVLEEMGCEYEVIIVNDGSLDRTAEVAEALARRHAGVRVVHHERNRGYGAALKTGLTTARYEYIFFTDGDNQFDVRDLRRFVALLDYSDLVVGFRNRKCYTFFRRVVSFTYNLVLHALFGLPYRDVDCAFKLIPKRLIDQTDFSSVQAIVNVELLINAQRLGLSVTEIGVTHYPREAGVTTVNPRVILAAISELSRFYLKVQAEDWGRSSLSKIT
jgi:glycosyltransferase involved in cell wall biosynthesis